MVVPCHQLVCHEMDFQGKEGVQFGDLRIVSLVNENEVVLFLENKLQMAIGFLGLSGNSLRHCCGEASRQTSSFRSPTLWAGASFVR